jgi:hypothetical protein
MALNFHFYWAWHVTITKFRHVTLCDPWLTNWSKLQYPDGQQAKFYLDRQPGSIRIIRPWSCSYPRWVDWCRLTYEKSFWPFAITTTPWSTRALYLDPGGPQIFRGFYIVKMPTKNITIDNISPLINYSPVGGWSEGNSSDPYFSKPVQIISCDWIIWPILNPTVIPMEAHSHFL